jgi:uncharacterized membrane protein YphA (DoxX/SURF4 family)
MHYWYAHDNLLVRSNTRRKTMSALQGPVTVLGRVLLSTIFFMAAVGNKMPHFSQVARVMDAVGIPAPQLMLVGAIVFLIAGSLSVILGYKARVGAGLLLTFLVLAFLLLPLVLEPGGASPARADGPLHEKPVHDGSDAVHRGEWFGADEFGFLVAQARNRVCRRTASLHHGKHGVGGFHNSDTCYRGLEFKELQWLNQSLCSSPAPPGSKAVRLSRRY